MFIKQFKIQNASVLESAGIMDILNATVVAAGGGLQGVSALLAGSSENRSKELDDTAKQHYIQDNWLKLLFKSNLWVCEP